MFSSISERMIKGVGITIDGDTLDLSINIKNTNCSKNLPVDFIDKLILYPKNKDLKKLAECLSCERFVKINAQHPKKLNYTKYALSKKYINTEDYIVFKEIILEVRELVYKRETNKVYSKKINSTVKALCD